MNLISVIYWECLPGRIDEIYYHLFINHVLVLYTGNISTPTIFAKKSLRACFCILFSFCCFSKVNDPIRWKYFQR